MARCGPSSTGRSEPRVTDPQTTILYALSTLAQTCAALAAFVGAVGLYRLQSLSLTTAGNPVGDCDHPQPFPRAQQGQVLLKKQGESPSRVTPA